MMREIKFRVWDKKLPEMIIISEKSDFLLLFGNKKPILQMYSNGGEFVDQWEPDHVMQFTGLSDKNGVDIYEGDIVLYCHSKIVIEWSDSLIGGDHGLCCGFPIGCDPLDSKVIGNIYQDAHLIKEGKE